MNLEPYRSGSTEPWTVDVMATLIRAKMPHIVVETGTFEARTTCAFLDAMSVYAPLHTSMLYTVESDPERHKVAGERVAAHGRDLCEAMAVRVFLGDALEFLASDYLQGAVDFVFLDDDHAANHVHEELRLVSTLLRPGGICCVHDVIGPFGLGAVVESYGGIILDFPRLHAAGGLGLIVKS